MKSTAIGLTVAFLCLGGSMAADPSVLSGFCAGIMFGLSIAAWALVAIGKDDALPAID